MKEIIEFFKDFSYVILAIIIFFVILISMFSFISILTIFCMLPIILCVSLQNINYILLYVVFGVPILVYLFKNAY